MSRDIANLTGRSISDSLRQAEALPAATRG
jgi:hypothetical protein